MSLNRTKLLVFLLLLAGPPVYAVEVYHWIDDDGVANFSQERPAADIPGIKLLTIEDAAAPDYDPEEDRYGVQAQAERMAALRESMETRRAEQRRLNQYSSRQPEAPYYESERSYRHGIWLPPRYPVRPPKPEHPIVRPYPTSTLDPSFLSSR